ncbi:hypothetical protein RND71_037018 [Anisodus tanguticus]|uniref:Uncharacterized protein n=1 Tax=Anisodus tanguticus TaxID=243964 RepID=A0AAE1R388_9SOLA|nr:hypothetical protein RND71_037018 [Anisodus tanguticus]
MATVIWLRSSLPELSSSKALMLANPMLDSCCIHGSPDFHISTTLDLTSLWQWNVKDTPRTSYTEKCSARYTTISHVCNVINVST